MSYTQIDSVLFSWAQTHGLHVYTKHHDEDVRSLDIVDDAGDSYQLSLFFSDIHDTVSILISEKIANGKHIPSRKVRSHKYATTITELQQTLDSAYQQVEMWISERQHKRTPV